MLRRVHADLFVPSSQSFMALHGMRAFAILAVTLCHCTIYAIAMEPDLDTSGRSLPLHETVLSNFWSGVDIFFVLSGFLIGRILLRDLARHGRLFYPSFFVRRGFRIFPVFYLVLSVSLFVLVPRAEDGLFSHLWETSGYRRQLIAEWQPHAGIPDAQERFDEEWTQLDQQLLLASAWTHYAYVSNYLIERGSPNVMFWAWSLCIEEHFYLLLPPLLWLTVRRRRRVWHLVGLAIGLAVPFAARLAAYLRDPGVGLGNIYPLSHNRMDELFVGVVIAYAYVHHRATLESAARRAGALLPLVGALAIGSVWIWGSPALPGAFRLVFQFPLLAWGSACFLVHGIATRGAVARALSWRFWYPIARVSYGMYLVHPIVLFGLLVSGFGTLVTQYPRGLVLVPLYLATAGLSWLVAAVLFTAFERPLLDLGGRLAGRWRAGATSAS